MRKTGGNRLTGEHIRGAYLHARVHMIVLEGMLGNVDVYGSWLVVGPLHSNVPELKQPRRHRSLPSLPQAVPHSLFPMPEVYHVRQGSSVHIPS